MTTREKIVGELLRDLVGTVKGGYDAKEIRDEILRHIRESESEEYYRLTIVNGACTAKGYFKTMDGVTETIIRLEALPDVRFEYQINKVKYDTAERCVPDIKNQWDL